MVKIPQRAIVALTATLLAMSIVWAHPPYERVSRSLGDTSTGQVTLIKSYVDGIVFTDPVKLVVRNREGGTVSETEYARDLAILCWSSVACTVFQYDGFLPLAPSKVWRLSPAGLISESSAGLWLLGIVVPYFEHWLGYLIAVGSVLVPLAGLVTLRRRPAGAARSVMLWLVSIATLLLVPIWLYAIVALSDISLPLVVALLGMLVAVRFAFPRRAKEHLPTATRKVVGDKAAQQPDAPDRQQPASPPVAGR